jgi:hypothetical protein
MTPNARVSLLSKILERVADAIQPFGFALIENSLSLSLPEDTHQHSGKRTDLPGQLADRQTNELQCVYEPTRQFHFNSPASTESACRSVHFICQALAYPV